MKPPANTLQDHALEWNDRLLDLLDADAEPVERARIEKHLAGCALCQQQMTQFERLDGELRTAAAPLSLDETFDARLFGQLDMLDEAQRAAAKQRIQQELQSDLRALSRDWRRTLLMVVPGIFAGVAIAFAIAGYFDTSGVTQTLVSEGADELGRSSSGTILTVLTTLYGALIGGGVAWFAARNH